MKFTVDRATWYRGKGNVKSSLLTDSGERCCLGFFAKACGLSDDVTLGVGMPANIRVTLPKEMTWLRHSNYANFSSDLACDIASTNDCQNIDDEQREKELTELFKKANHEIVFA